MKDVARPDIKPAFAERNVPVVFATDANYLPYLKVTINSAIANAGGSNLDILVLHSGVDEGLIQAFISRYAGLENVSVRFVDMSDGLAGSRLSEFKQVDRLPVSSCYRLLIPDILTAYDKLVYLDVDVAACRDLGELYATELGEAYFAAAKDVVHSTKPEYLAWAAGWGFAEWEGYVNAGILVMNLKQFRREPILDRLLTVVLEATKWLCDQDALNFVCKGRIAPLDPRWNVQLGGYCLKKQLALTGEDMWIVHFTGAQKPWRLPARRYSHLWWRHVDASDVLRLWGQAWGESLVATAPAAPKVSVVMPVYNAARYLPEALASVLMQKDLPEVEVICVNDGSTDDSAAVLDFWKGRDPRLCVLEQPRQGPGVARNAGLDAARGDYVFFLDADDRLSSGAALRQGCAQARADDLDLLVCDATHMSEMGEETQANVEIKRNMLPGERVFGPDALGPNLYVFAGMCPWAKLFRRKFIQEQELRFPALERSEDFPMTQLALSLARRLGVMLQSAVHHRINVATSLESTKDETPLIFAEADRIFRRSLAARGLQDKFRRAADVALLVNMAYNLCKVNLFSSFRAVARLCAEEMPALSIDAAALAGTPFAWSFKRIAEVVAALDDTEALADLFADIRDARCHYFLAQGDKRLAQLRAEKAALQDRLAAAVKAKSELGRRVQVSEKRKAELWQQKQAADVARMALWQRLQAADMARTELWRQKQAAEAAKAELWQRLQAAEKAKADLWQQRQAAEAAKADLWQQRQAAEAAKAELWQRLQAAEKAKAALWRQKQAADAAKADVYGRLQEKEARRSELERILEQVSKVI